MERWRVAPGDDSLARTIGAQGGGVLAQRAAPAASGRLSKMLASSGAPVIVANLTDQVLAVSGLVALAALLAYMIFDVGKTFVRAVIDRGLPALGVAWIPAAIAFICCLADNAPLGEAFTVTGIVAAVAWLLLLRR